MIGNKLRSKVVGFCFHGLMMLNPQPNQDSYEGADTLSGLLARLECAVNILIASRALIAHLVHKALRKALRKAGPKVDAAFCPGVVPGLRVKLRRKQGNEQKAEAEAD
jgi:hypothetical protein